MEKIISCVLSVKEILLLSHYICKTNSNAKYRWNIDINLTESSEPLKFFPNNFDYCFTYTIISNALKMLTPGRS